MNWDSRTVLLAVLVGLVVLGGVAWIAIDLRRQPQLLPPAAPLGEPGVTGAVRPSYHPQLEAGIEAQTAGDLARARQLLESVPEGDPSYTVALVRLGEVLSAAGDLRGAARSYEALIAIQPDNPEGYARLARTLYRLEDLHTAEFFALRALEVEPGHTPSRYLVALSRVAQGGGADSVVAYARAFRADRTGAGRAAAEQELRTLAQQRPELADPHYALAFFANSRGDARGEVEALQRFLALQPDGPVADNARQRLTVAEAAIPATPAD